MFSHLTKLSFSKLTLILMSIIIIYLFFSIKIWKQKNVIENDVLCYYGYLPATFINHDVTLSFLDTNKNSPLHQVWTSANFKGKKVIKMSMGLSFLYSPFFFIAHYIAAPMFGYPQDGFCRPYQKFQIGRAHV